MGLAKKALKKLKGGAYFPFYLTFYKRLPLDEKRILLESRHGSALESNIYALCKELGKEDYASFTVVVPARKGKMAEFKAKLAMAGLSRAVVVPHGSISYYKELSRAKFLVNDVSFPGRYIKKEGQRMLNVWHGTPLKKMGRDDLEERASLGNMLRNFLQSDYLIYPNAFMEWVMTTSFMLPGLYQGKILHTGYPRNDVFFDEQARERLREELGFAGKRVYAYLPTYRGLSYKVDGEDGRKRLAYLEELEKGLGEEELLLYKPHPLEGGAGELSGFSKILSFPSGYDTDHVLHACDGLLTDYSSVFFDFAVSGRSVVLFPYDREQYMAGRGLYVKPEELPFPSASSIEEVLALLRKEPGYGEEIRDKYMTWENGHGSRDCLRALLFDEIDCEAVTLSGSGKEKVLLYAGNLAQNGVTTAFCNLYEAIDKEKRDYYVCFRTESVKEEPERINRLPADALLFPLSSEMNLDPVTMVAQVIFLKTGFSGLGIKKRLQEAYAREWRKHFLGTDFSHVVHYNGYEDYILSLFMASPCKRSIYCHSQMLMEMKTRKMASRPLVEEAYRSYAPVVCVSEEGAKEAKILGGEGAKVVVAPNLQDTQEVVRRSNLPLTFDAATKSTHTLEQVKAYLSGEESCFICLGRFSREKGQVALLSMFQRFIERGNKAVLFLVGGGGPDGPMLLEKIKEAGLEDKVVLIYSLSNPMPLLSACDLLIIPSLYEGCPVAAYEAAALSVPVLSAKVPGCRELAKSTGMALYEGEEEGISLMEAALRGEIAVMQVDFEERKERALSVFEEMLKK